jgi:hypothetical protein
MRVFAMKMEYFYGLLLNCTKTLYSVEADIKEIPGSCPTPYTTVILHRIKRFCMNIGREEYRQGLKF